MFHWKKLGKVFNPEAVGDRPWLSEFAQAPATLVFEDFVRVYFSCRPPADANGQYLSYSAFIDLDRNDLFRVLHVADRPILSLGGRGEFDEFGTYPVSVIRVDDEIRAYYGGWTRCESVPFNVAIGAATSVDGGETFKKLGRGPVLSYSPDEPFIISGPKIRRFDDRWFMSYVAGRKWSQVGEKVEPVYKIRAATSDDGVTWTRMDTDLIEDRLGEDEAQASPDVFYSGGRYHMFFCYRQSFDYRSKPNSYRIGYATSSDLTHWSRDDAKAGIDVSDSGWDADMISYPHLFRLDDQTYMAYLGNEFGRHGFGLAELVGNLD